MASVFPGNDTAVDNGITVNENLFGFLFLLCDRPDKKALAVISSITEIGSQRLIAAAGGLYDRGTETTARITHTVISPAGWQFYYAAR